MKRPAAAAVTAVALLAAVALTLPSNTPPKETQTMGFNNPAVPGANLPAGEDHVMRRLADIERAIREMRAADILKTAGLIAAPNLLTVAGGLVVNGSETVNGPLAVHGTAAFDGATTIGGTLGVTGPTTLGGATTVSGNTTVSGTLGVSGNTTLGAPTTVSGSLAVSGPMTVSGTLSLPAGIIDNAALTSPVAPGSVYGNAVNFALTTTLTTIKAITVTVPAGMTKASVSVVGRVLAINNNTTGGTNAAGADYLSVRTTISGLYGYALPLTTLGQSSSSINVAAYAAVLSGLTPGGTFDVSVAAFTAYLAWAANTVNTAEISGSIQWYR